MRGLILPLPALVLLTLLFAGCGGRTDKPNYRAEGTVTFQGKPIPQGEIWFIPDVAAGNEGAAGSAKIIDGKYDTSADGIGYIAGENLIRISGFDGVAFTDSEGNMMAQGRPLFKSYETKQTLEAGGGTFDFDVPR
ncbi:MAG: hypothetical protein NXI22_25810 [bacterium]|nr:hypothetical protein [bacterium]